MGRDHTLFALEPGYVKMYKEPRQTKHATGSSNVLQAPSFRNMTLSNPATGQPVAAGATSSSTASSSSFSTTTTDAAEESIPADLGTNNFIKRKERRFIGIALDRDEMLPRNQNAQGRSRRLGLVQLE
jgi:hypothetical protein